MPSSADDDDISKNRDGRAVPISKGTVARRQLFDFRPTLAVVEGLESIGRSGRVVFPRGAHGDEITSDGNRNAKMITVRGVARLELLDFRPRRSIGIREDVGRSRVFSNVVVPPCANNDEIATTDITVNAEGHSFLTTRVARGQFLHFIPSRPVVLKNINRAGDVAVGIVALG